ncbi:helix-turn-helix domain-containing protein [Chitinophaga barathri]|uniref:Transcriptional regulator n=1 Tax=Chitinophaga barathri TaxID=1647451 RepID=A0A3N4MER3_9BACT|nr:helix-turn-helix domain-containing protein [Chitinophaga barathri]RPD38580.1 transcriptional regulator [Chitinophaga barathri]
MKTLEAFVKLKRKETSLTQQEFAEKAGVALTVVQKIEQGKNNLQLKKVNQVLKMFGHTLAPISLKQIKDEESEDIL